MDHVTVDQIQDAIKQNNIQWWSIRNCSLCQAALGYYFLSGLVFYSSACDCTSYSSDPRESSYEDVADLFNRQEPAVRKRMWDSFLASGAPDAN